MLRASSPSEECYKFRTSRAFNPTMPDIKRVLLELEALHEVTGEAKPWRLRWSQDRRSVAT
jgi:hypothetical protein